MRNSLIRSYRIYKGKHLDTTEWHPHIKWRNGEDKIPEVENDGTWDMKVSQEIVSMGVVKKKPTVKSKNTATKHHIDTSSNLQEVKENPVTSGSSKRSRSGAIIEDNTVPFHSIWQSRVTAPSKMLKCHGCHNDFHGVPNSFGSHVINIVFFSSPVALNCQKMPKILGMSR